MTACKYIAMLSLSMMACFTWAQGETAPKPTLNFLNWEDYLEPELVAEFEQRTGIKVEQSYFEADEERDEIMASTDGHGFDLMIVNGFQVENYIRNGWLAALPRDFYKLNAHLDQRWIDAFPASTLYAVPYFWGTLGIAYRSDVIDSISSWDEFFRPQGKLRGKIAVLDSTRDTTAMAMKTLGHSVNSPRASLWAQSAELLQSQAPHVAMYRLVEIDESSELTSGEVYAAMMFSGDALVLQDEDERIEYVLPKEGGNIWVDYLVVSSRSKNQQAAWQFVNFLYEKDNMARQAEYVWYASPSSEVNAMMDEEFRTNTTIFPDAAALAKSEFYRPILPRRMKELDLMFEALMDSVP